MSSDNEAEKLNQSGTDNGAQMSAMIDKLLANPELINMVASAFGPSLRAKSEEGGGISEEKKEETVSEEGEKTDMAVAANDKLPELISTLAPMLSSLGAPTSKKLSAPPDRRACLLGALKPYLCKERCEAIDYMIKLGRISELFRSMN